MTMPCEEVRALTVEYYPDTDTLVLKAVPRPGPNGETVGRNLTAFTNDAGDVEGVTLEHAAALLLPHLAPDARRQAASQ